MDEIKKAKNIVRIDKRLIKWVVSIIPSMISFIFSIIVALIYILIYMQICNNLICNFNCGYLNSCAVGHSNFYSFDCFFVFLITTLFLIWLMGGTKNVLTKRTILMLGILVLIILSILLLLIF